MAKKNEAVEQATKLLEQGVEEVLNSGRFEEWLDVMSRFHSYSARNCILIMMQCPEATRVASYRKWQNDFNRQVRKGEKAIRILAPIAHKAVIRETDPTTGEVEDREHTWLSFKSVPVFDISQTDGDDLPTIAEDIDGSVTDFSNLCDRIQACATVPVEYGVEFTEPDLHGYFSEAEGRICIADGMSEAQTVKTLIHEVAHSMLHATDAEQEHAGKRMREVQAESVAYVVCKVLGIDSATYSFGYVASWGGDTKAVMRNLDVIRKTACDIIDSIRR